MSEDQAPLPGPGQSLDRLVAAKMGYEWEPFESGSGPSGQWVIPGTNRTAYDVRWIHQTGLFQPEYSTDIGAAWELVEYLKGKNIGLDLHNYDMSNLDEYAAEFFSRDDTEARAYGNTAPLAICLAFLALPDFEVEE